MGEFQALLVLNSSQQGLGILEMKGEINHENDGVLPEIWRKIS